MTYKIKNRKSVLGPMKKCDDLGRETFLHEYGYGKARKYFVLHPHTKKRYDSKAIAAAAIGCENLETGHPKAKGESFVGGEQLAKPLLKAIGFEVVGATATVAPDGEAADQLRKIAKKKEDAGYFDAENLEDDRERTQREIVERRGKGRFRERLIKEYRGCCIVTKCDAVSALEAAHIVPYSGSKSDHFTNGLLLRADIHTLFELDLISIHADSLKVVLAGALQGTCYKEIEGKQLAIAHCRAALKRRWKMTQKRR